MAIIAFSRRSDQPQFGIKKAAQAIWVAPNGDTTFNLECILDLTNLSSESPLNEVMVIAGGEAPVENVTGENNLFLHADFCEYLYNGEYERRGEQFVKLLVAPNDPQYVKIAQIRNIEIAFRNYYSRIRIFFQNLCEEQSNVCDGKVVKYAGFRIKYFIPKYAKRIKRHLYTEATWTISLRPYDNKVLGELARNEEIVDLEVLYYWVVLPRGFFVTAYAPMLHDIRNLEVDPWMTMCPRLKKDQICYSWKVGSIREGVRFHLDFREPSFNPAWACWAFLITTAGLLITLLLFCFRIFSGSP